MTDKSPTHEWINTGIATLALIAAGASGYTAWQDHRAKLENAVIAIRPSRACSTHLSSGDTIDSCWLVRIGNLSDNPLALLSYNVTQVGFHSDNDPPAQAKLETLDGKQVTTINIDANKATDQPYLLRIPIHVSQDAAKIIATMSASPTLGRASFLLLL